MLHIYATFGVWNSDGSYVADETKGGRLVGLESTTTFEELKMMILEDFSIQPGAEIELSYLPGGLIDNARSPRIVIGNDRQLKNFVAYMRKAASKHLCLTLTDPVQNQNNRFNNDLNTEQRTKSHIGDNDGYVSGKAKINKNNMSDVDVDDDDDGVRTKKEIEDNNQLRFALMESVKKEQDFLSKRQLKSYFEILAMKHNVDYVVVRSDATYWTIRCAERICKWGVNAVNLEGSAYFIVKNYVGEHTCAPSSKTKIARSASAKAIGNLILQKYEGVKEGPRPNDIIQLMLKEHGCEISYSLAWEAREYAVNQVRGIPEKSYGKIPKYLHMLKEANPGTHTAYKIDTDGSFRYLFMAFGQSVRGFYRAMRRVIVIDGTFLKNKYKGTLLVATALDGNSNLYPIAFGVVDAENDLSWEWFLRELRVVIADDDRLAFVSDRHVSIGKALAKVYQRASHGICIHHMLNNVVTYYPRKGKGLVGLIAKASKAYRLVDFQRLMTDIVKISAEVGKYLLEADVRKWARCLLNLRYWCFSYAWIV